LVHFHFQSKNRRHRLLLIEGDSSTVLRPSTTGDVVLWRISIILSAVEVRWGWCCAVGSVTTFFAPTKMGFLA
jgi:hypothetical protein